MIFDTGAQVLLIDENLFKKVSNDAPLFPVDNVIREYSGRPINIKGAADVIVEANNNTQKLCVLVVKGHAPSIYGCDWIKVLQPDFHVTLVTDTKAKLILKEGTTLVFCKPRPLPYGLVDAVKEELDRLVQEKILFPTDQSDWATPIVPVRKPSGKIRVCGDYKVTLNPHLSNMVSTTPHIEDIINNMHSSSWFSEIDLENAYHQIPLDEESSQLTTISTPFGLYRYKTLPFGIKQCPSVFQTIINKIMLGMSGVDIYQDNIYVHGKTRKDHDVRLKEVLARLNSNNLKVNENKCSFGKREINVLGTIVSENSTRPDPKKVEAVHGFVTPTSVSDVRSFLGLIDWYGHYIPNLATVKEPLTRLLHNNYNQSFVWHKEQQVAFETLKKAISGNTMMTSFDSKKQVVLKCDASPVGVGAVLEQNEKPILFVSKTLSKAERNYSQIEREALAIVWAIKRLHKYLFDRKFDLVTDNKPLFFIFNPNKAVPVMTAARLQRWSLFLMAYDYNIVHKSASENKVADTLSRYQTSCAESDTFDVNYVQDTILPCPVSKNRVLKVSKADKEMRMLYTYIKNGWSSKTNFDLRNYAVFKNEFSLQDSLIYRGARLVIPPSLRKEVLNRLHEGHIGTDAIKSIARQCVWWPSIDHDIQMLVKTCTECCESKSHSRARWTSWPEETRKWDRVHIDLAGPFGRDTMALVMVDAYSKWPEVHLMYSTTSAEVIKRLRRTFAQEGVPMTLVSDNGPQFVSDEIEAWLKNVGCHHIRTPPYHPRSNGLAERFVQTLKNHLRCVKGSQHLQTSVDRFLMQYRNSKHSTTGVAPAIRMRGHLLRSPVIALSAIGDKVWTRKYHDKTQLWQAAEVVGLEGRNVINAKLDNGTFQRCHIEQTKPRLDGTTDTTLDLDPALDENILPTDIQDFDEVQNSKTRTSKRIKTSVSKLQYHKLGGCN